MEKVESTEKEANYLLLPVSKPQVRVKVGECYQETQKNQASRMCVYYSGFRN